MSEDQQKALMKLSKETLVSLFISANKKATKYAELQNIIREMVE